MCLFPDGCLSDASSVSLCPPDGLSAGLAGITSHTVASASW